MNKELDGEELIFIAMKDLWSLEGMIQCLESVLAEPPNKEGLLAMLREMRQRRSQLEDAVEKYTEANPPARRLYECK